MNLSKELEYALSVDDGLIDAYRYGSDTFFRVINEAKANIDSLEISESERDFISTEIGEFGLFNGEEVPLDFPISSEDFTSADHIYIVDEYFGFVSAAEYQGKDVELNKPMKGDVKKFKVFVKDPKTGNVRKINFGLNVTRKLLEDPERRAAFTARHNCEQANDKLTPSYWSCRVNRYFHKIYGGEPIGGKYW